MGGGRTPEIQKLGACSSTSKRLREMYLRRGRAKGPTVPTAATTALTLPLTVNHLRARVYNMANHVVIRINQDPPSVNHLRPWLRRSLLLL